MLPTIREIRRLTEAGVLTPQSLRLALEPGDLDLIERTPSITIWYPVEIQDRFNLVIREALGGHDADLIEFSRRTAEEVLSVRAMQFLLMGVRRLRVSAGPNLIRMAHFAFSFGQWQFIGDDLRDFRVVGTGLEPMPDTFRYATQGFIEHLAADITQEPIRCHSTRHRWGEIEFEASVRREVRLTPPDAPDTLSQR